MSTAFQYFRAKVVRRPCPCCGRPTGVGFEGQPDPFPDPTKCTRCAADNIEFDVQAASILLGYPLMERGPCVRCRQPCRRYGDHGHPLCGSCRGLPDQGPALTPDQQALLTDILGGA